MEPLYSPQSRAERLIAAGRVVLAASSLFAVWLDPSEPAKYASIAYSLLVAYVGYAALIALLVWRADAPRERQGVLTHVVDLVFFSLFIYFTAGPASPFNVYFVFSMVGAALRWQWRGALWTALASLASYVGVSLWFVGVLHDPVFDLHRFIVRGVYLAVVAVLLGYLGAHERRTRHDMALLASFPQAMPGDLEAVVSQLLAHAGRVVGAPRVLLAWAEREEPWLYVAQASAGAFTWQRESPASSGGMVAEPLAAAGFLTADAAHDQPAVLMKQGGMLQRFRGAPLDPTFRERWEARAVLSLPLSQESFEGRLFFFDRPRMTSDDLVLGEIVAGVVAARLHAFYLSRDLQEAVATEERIRLARDLHDGVLQSLTGIGLRLAAVHHLVDGDRAAAREAVEGLQRLIALEQRDLRFFIRELSPPRLAPPGEAQSLTARINELVHRIELEWGLRVELRTEGIEDPIPATLAREVHHVVREALVNAVRHGEATVVSVVIARAGERLEIVVADNGRGFPFHGRFTHAALAAAGLGPRTLCERVASLAGTLALDSSPTGARLDIVLPCTGEGS